MTPLRVVIERQGGPATSRTFDADVVVGRSEKADVCVDDTSVSRRHARLYRQEDEWFVEDLGSRNGTELNGRPIDGPTLLHPRDVIRVGATLLRVGDGDASGGSAQAPSRAVPAMASGVDDAIYSVLRPAADMIAADQRASVRLKLITEVHRALAGPIAREDLLEMLLEQAFSVLQPEQGAIFLKKPDGTLERAAERTSSAAAGPMLVSRRLADEVVGKGSAALVLDVLSDQRFAQAQSIVASGVRSILAAPLSDAEGCLGMIALYSSVQARRFSEQDLEVLVSIASAAAMRMRNIDLAQAAAERRLLDREIELARDIQMDLLSRRPPERPEVQLAATVTPARTVGGDFYDFLIDGDKLWFVVADVSGKGIGAALMMAVGQTLFRAVASSGKTLAEVMAHMNRELARDNDRAIFITALAGCLHLDSGQMQLANAGHNLPYRIASDGAVALLNVKNSIALGVKENATFPETGLTLAPGDGVVLYTDGVCDAINAERCSYGTAGLEACLRQLGAAPADAIVRRVCESVAVFAGGAPQEDDITVAAVRYRG